MIAKQYVSGEDRHGFVHSPFASAVKLGIKASRVLAMVVIGASVLGAHLPVEAQTPAARPSPKKRTIVDGGAYLQAREQAVLELRGMQDAVELGNNPRQIALQVLEAQLQAQEAARARAGRGETGARALRSLTTNSQTWTEIGPMPIPNGQTEAVVTPVSGRVTALEIDPTNTNRLYLGTANGGVWRSLDGGTTWTPIFDGAQSLAIGSLTLAPSDPNILYVGTGEANGSADSFAGVGLYRIDNAPTTATLVGPINPVRNYIAVDGVTAVSTPAFNGRSISRILVHPTDPSIVFVGVAGGVIGMGADAPFGGALPPLAMRGLYRLNGANGAAAAVTVEKLAVTTFPTGTGAFDSPNTGNRNVNDMIFPDPADPSVLVVWINGTTAAGDGGIFRSTNATAANPTFTQVLATTVASARAMFAGYSNGAASTIYVATGETSTATTTPVNPATDCNNAAQSGALRRSTDGGVTWSTKLPGGGGFCGGQCFYNLGLDVRPGATTATDKLWLGGNVTSATCSRLNAISTNGAATFSNAASGLHADTHFIKVDPVNANVVYHGNDGGVFKSTNGGTTWVSLNLLSATEFQSIATHPTSPKFTIGGTQDNGTSMYTPAATWNRIDFGDGGYARIDQSNTSLTTPLMYHTYFNQRNTLIGFGRNSSVACAADGNWAYKGIYGGAVDTFVVCDGSTDTFNGIGISDFVNFYAPLELGPSVVPGGPNTVYFGTDRLYRSTDKGDTMTVVSQAPLVASTPIRTVHVSRLNDNFRIVGLNNGKVFATTTGSATLNDVTGNLPTPLKQVLRVMFDPNDATGNTAYVALGGYWGASTGHVFRTTNLTAGAATTWAAASGSGLTAIPDIPVNCLLIDPYDSNALYACTDVGVYYSSNAGTSWNPLGAGLPRVPVFEMAFSAGTTGSRALRIATHGRGMWEILPPASCVLDLDGNGVHDAATDGLLILRAMLGITDSAAVTGAIGAGAIRSSWSEVQSVLNLNALDVDGNGTVDALTDGLIILRAMLGAPGTDIANSTLGSGTLQRPTWADIRGYLNGRCSGAFAL
jgi:hypothetical protein